MQTLLKPPPLSPEPFPERVDSTALSDARLCSRRWYWKWLYGIEPRASSIHLVAGGAYARGLEVARSLYYTGDPRFYLNLDACIPYAWRAAVEHWGSTYVAPPEATKQLWRVLEALQFYFQEFPPGTDPFQPMRWDNGKPAIEFTFALPLEGTVHPTTGNPIMYTGRLDLIAEREGRLWLVDDKTCSQLGAQWPRQWDLRSQFLGYMNAIGAALSKPIDGCLVRGMCFRKHGYETAEKLVHFHRWQADEWLESTTRFVQRLLSEHKAGLFDKVYSDACNSFGGCNFRDLCTSRDPEPWIQTEYQHFSWDPITLETKLNGEAK